MKKEEFYPLVKKLLERKGYKYYSEEDLRGKGRGRRKPDFVAIRGNWFLIGEIKSPSEPPTSGSWRTVQSFDTENMRHVREMVKALEKEGKIAPEVGGHAIIMLGQVYEYLLLMGERWLPPEPVEGYQILGAYAFPVEWSHEVEEALRFFRIKPLARFKDSKVMVVIFELKKLERGGFKMRNRAEKNELKKDLRMDKIGIANKEVISPCLTCKYKFICFFLPFLKDLCPKHRGKVY